MDDLAKRSALEKIAYLLQRDEQDFSFLYKLEAQEINRLYEWVLERLQLDNSPFWERLAKVTAFIPNFINARIAEDILGAHITANLTYHVPVQDALAISRYFSVEFMAELAQVLVPGRAQHILHSFPVQDMKKIMHQLLRKKNYYTLGNFVDYLPIETLLVLAQEIHNEEDLLRIAVFSSNKQHLANMLCGFTDDRLLRLVQAAHRLGLWNELLGVVSFFDDSLRQRMANIAQDFGPSELLAMLKAACGLQLAADMARITQFLAEKEKARLAQLVPQLSDEELVAYIRGSCEVKGEKEILQIAVYFTEQDYERVAQLLPQLEDMEILGLIAAAFPARLVPVILKIASYLPDEQIPRLRKLMGELGDGASDEMKRLSQELSLGQKIHDILS
ncbi:MAG: hypothetical protein NZM25_01475 [Leptospiraceae bacterium]|nr:hypothetical protein [Leptospiraceae bacterium]MDW8307615.1 hypothetical protein [Leptospiraceae bacterium]